jgi:hypothetical protein
MSIRRKDLPLPPARKQERSRELELELPVPLPEERPAMQRKVDERPERGELVIDMFGPDDIFSI